MGVTLPRDITATRNKQKMTAEMVAVDDYQKKQKRASFNVCVEIKNVNGQPKTCFKLDEYGPGPKNEYTNAAQFKKVVAENIDNLAKELG